MLFLDLDPWGNYYFALEIDGVEVAHFHELAGIKTSSTTFEFEEGGLNGRTHKRVGQSKFENLTLKQASSTSTQLVEWRDKYVTDKGWGDRESTSGALVIKSNAGIELRRYSFNSMWPVSWEGPSLNSGGSELAIETLEIAFDTMKLDAKEPKGDPPKKDPPKKFETEPIQFELDSAELTPEGQETMDELNEDIAECDVQEIWVEGHTCWLGPGGAGSSQSHAYNQTLSAERAATCAASIQENNPDVIVHSAGFSFDHPIVSNSTSARRFNRRVEFWTEARSGTREGELE